MVLPRDDPNPQGGGRSTGGGTAGTGQGDGATTSGGSVRPAAPVRSFGNAVSLPAMEKLKGRQNYASWSFAMKMILIREGTWRAVKPAEEQIVDPEMCERAFATICLSLEKQNYSLVKTAKSAREAWEKLQQAFQDNGLIRRFGLLDKLTSVKLEECETVEDYVDQLVTTSNDLSEIGFEVNDQWLASLLLKGLPEYYNPMIMGLQASGINLTADVVKTKIIQDVKWPLKTSSAGGALYTKPKSKHSRVDKKSGLCFTCNKPGHFASNCPQKSTSKPKGKALCATLAVGTGGEDCWYFDSGATAHMTRSEDGFVKQVDWVHPIDTASSHSIKSVAKGTVNLELDEGSIEVKDVLMVPELSANLLSISKICEKNMTVLFKTDGCEVRDENGDMVVTGIQQDGMYRLITKNPPKAFLMTDMELWHRRLGHLNKQFMGKLTTLVDGLELRITDMDDCIACAQGKHCRGSFHSSASRATDLLDLVHSDVCGPIEVPSIGGSRYFVTFVDDASHKVFLYFIESKSQVKEVYEQFKAMVERQSGRKLKVLRTDNGTEYVNLSLKKIMQRDGVVHQTTCPYSPEQNGTAERMNRTLVEKARSMLNDAGLSKKFWAEAVSTAAYLVNRSFTRAVNGKTPEEAWSQKKPNLKHLRVFGSRVMVHCPKQKRQKFDPKSVEGIFVGYGERSKGFRVFNPATNDVIISRDVVFINEGRPLTSTSTEDRSQPVEFMELHSWLDMEENQANDAGESDDGVLPGSSTEQSTVSVPAVALPPQSERSAEEQQGLRRSGRERQPTGKYTDFVCLSSTSGSDGFTEPIEAFPGQEQTEPTDDPISYAEVLQRSDRNRWLDAMREELEALDKNETWELTELPKGKKAIRNKWIFKTKYGSDGKVDRLKARLVVKGCSQRYGIDYEEVYAPVVRYSTIRYLMALAVEHDLEIDQMDAVTAFLQGRLTDEEIYMDQPEGFIKDPSKVCKLKKALYGLKQSSRIWNLQLDEALQEFGLKRSEIDPCLYFKMEGGRMMFVTIYVDDFLLFTNDEALKKKLKAFLNSRFKMKDLGEAKLCLGLRITRDRPNGNLWLDQKQYLEDILERFNMANCNSVSTPADPSAKLDKTMCPTDPEEVREMQMVPYKEAVGSLMYAAYATRPDIAFAVNTVSKFSNNPGRRHWEAVKRIIRYLKGTMDHRLQFSKQSNPDLTGYSDADWGGDVEERKSTTGYVFTKMGGAISWNSKRQEVVALSTCEAEYIALSRTAQEALWWQQLLKQLDDQQVVPIMCDNQSAICLAKNQGFNPKTKHIAIRYHFVRDMLNRGYVILDYVPTKQQPADGLTKPLTKQNHENFKRMLGIVS